MHVQTINIEWAERTLRNMAYDVSYANYRHVDLLTPDSHEQIFAAINAVKLCQYRSVVELRLPSTRFLRGINARH
jgi:hypothetical protein